ncbi:M24 family metallopeptidase [Georgenia sp. EYE_87]|uniref:M24 family metallopeptidase n=1 Tax=Georgenia sp. EYE_87 TaxID=2853448 RepID=UPI002006A10E|nr:M24 family metallopeptidase [Georgenia sp. EYE_87]MCK6210768.1 M24 family metallopeptidase [Georgenia sp. EYE_87]
MAIDTALAAPHSTLPDNPIQSLAERDLRWARLHAAMESEGYDALLFAAADYRGHKGSLRYISNYNLCHRYGYAVMFAGEEPIVVLPQNLEADRRPASRWVSDYRFPYNLGSGLAEILSSKGTHLKVGIVGLGQVMKVEDYLAVTTALPTSTFEDASALFDRVRAIKSPAELRAAGEGAYILDACFDRLLEVARPGMTEQQVAAEMFHVGSRLGGQDPLFLTMYAEQWGETARATFGQPEDRVLGVNDVFTFSYEIVGPSGYWVELSRMVTFAPPSDAVGHIGNAVALGMEAARAALTPGTPLGDVQREVISAVEAQGARSEYWSGHGLGMDVLEEPWVGLDVVQDSGKAGAVTTTESGMVLTIHPTLWDETTRAMGYMANTFVIDDGGAKALSRHPVTIHTIS